MRFSRYAPRNGQLGRPTRSLCSAGPESSGSIRCLLLRDLYAQQPRHMRSSHRSRRYSTTCIRYDRYHRQHDGRLVLDEIGRDTTRIDIELIPEKDLTEDLPVNLLTRDVNMIVLSKIDALLQTHPNSSNYSLSIHNGGWPLKSLCLMRITPGTRRHAKCGAIDFSR